MTALFLIMEELFLQIRSMLTPDLVKPEYRNSKNYLAGHCYAASEALYHMLGGKEAGYTPQVLNYSKFPEGLKKGQTHWFLKNAEGEVLDVTAKQFKVTIPYDKDVGTGFLTKQPSRRAQEIIRRVNKWYNLSLDKNSDQEYTIVLLGETT